MSAAGKLVGVGVGPGDPELITLKAVRVLEEADVVVHFAKSGTTGNARAIAERYLRPGIRELPLTFPVTTELPKEEAAYCDIIGAFYDAAALGVPLVLVPRAELEAAGARVQTRSERVLEMTGVPSVAEAAALAAAGPQARLIVPRIAARTATCALAVVGERS